MTKRSFPLLLSLCLLTVTLWAADNDNPFAGKWKLNPSRSRLTDEMKVAAVGPNKYAFNFSGDNVETIVVDGTDQPGVFRHHARRQRRCPRQLESRPQNRRPHRHHRPLETLRRRQHPHRQLHRLPSRRHNIQPALYLQAHRWHLRIRRHLGKRHRAGQLNLRDPDSALPGQRNLSHLSSVTKNVILDDKDYPNAGASAPLGYTSSGHRVNDHTVQMIDKMNGKLLNTQQVEVSPDGKTLTVTINIPGRDKPQIQVFERE